MAGLAPPSGHERMETPHITPQQRRQIARLHADGHSKTAIARRLGIDRHTVARQLVQRAPASADPTTAPLTVDDIAKLRFLLDRLSERENCRGCGATLYFRALDTFVVCVACGVVWYDAHGGEGPQIG